MGRLVSPLLVAACVASFCLGRWRRRQRKTTLKRICKDRKIVYETTKESALQLKGMGKVRRSEKAHHFESRSAIVAITEDHSAMPSGDVNASTLDGETPNGSLQDAVLQPTTAQKLPQVIY